MPLRKLSPRFGALLVSMVLQVAAQAPRLNVVILEGEGAINNIKQRTAREVVVRVEDENRRPVAGAAVAFSLPSQGAGGTFAQGSRLLTVLTDQNGRALAGAAGLSAGAVGAIVGGAAAVATGVAVAVVKNGAAKNTARIGVGGPAVVGSPH